MEAKYVCGYEGANGKLYETEEQASKSLKIVELKSKINRLELALREQKDSLRRQLGGDPYGGSYNHYHAYVGAIDKITDCPLVLLNYAEKAYETLNNKARLEAELEHLTGVDVPKQGFLYVLYANLISFFKK